MNVQETTIPGVLLVEPKVYQDSRGFFLETFHAQRYAQAGISETFVQDNHSHSRQGAIRGLHYQLPCAQGKLIWVVGGEVFDVAVDLRSDSPTFGRWFGITLSATNCQQIYLPPGTAHGFCTVSESADVFYKCTQVYSPEHEQTLLWNDPELAIDWPITKPLLSEKDQQGIPFRDSLYF